MGELVVKQPVGTFLSASLVTIATGLALFLFWDRLHRYVSGLARLDRYGPAAIFEHVLKGLTRVAAWHTRFLQHGDLAGYMRRTLAVLLMLGFGAWLVGEPDWTSIWSVLWTSSEQAWALAAAAVLIIAGGVAGPFLYDRLSLLMCFGLVGYGSAILFLFAGAPDVAFAQFVVETVLVVVATAVLARYGTPTRLAEPRLFNGTLAIAAGLSTFILLAHLFSLPADNTLAEWYAANSLPKGYGRNVVNVILDDFRALDTFGEIAVVAFSALAAWPVLAKMRDRGGAS
jgi:multicomponent Na+:H+ antiporter subunit A